MTWPVDPYQVLTRVVLATGSVSPSTQRVPQPNRANGSSVRLRKMHLPAFGPTIGLLVETAGDSPGVVRQEFQPNRGMGSWGNEVTEIGVLCTFKAPFAESASITDLLASLVSSFVALPVQTGFYQWYRAESIGDSLFHLGYRITTSNTSHPMFTFLNGP